MAISKAMQQKLEKAMKAEQVENDEPMSASRDADNGLLERIEKLEYVIRKIAHFSGNNRIILEAGIEPWFPGKDDMRKYKG